MPGWSSLLRLPCCSWQTHGVTGAVPSRERKRPVDKPRARAWGSGPEGRVSRTKSRRAVEMKHSIIFLLGARGAERSVEHTSTSARLATAMDPEFLLTLTLTGGRAGYAGTGTESPADRAAANGFANNRRAMGGRVIRSIRGRAKRGYRHDSFARPGPDTTAPSSSPKRGNRLALGHTEVRGRGSSCPARLTAARTPCCGAAEGRHGRPQVVQTSESEAAHQAGR